MPQFQCDNVVRPNNTDDLSLGSGCKGTYILTHAHILERKQDYMAQIKASQH